MSAAVSPAPFERSRNQESNLVRLSYTCFLSFFWWWVAAGSCFCRGDQCSVVCGMGNLHIMQVCSKPSPIKEDKRIELSTGFFFQNRGFKCVLETTVRAVVNDEGSL